MANFAKAQLLKYGWTEGKGLGKNENGIKNPIRANYKFDTAGIGHKENDTNWWESGFNKAAKNISVESETNGDVSITLQQTDDSLKKPTPVNKIYKNFCKTSTLSQGKLVPEDVSEEESDNPVIQDINKLSDEELFKVCGGRTAHKGARHGLSMNGKLERIARQEQELLTGKVLSENWKKTKTAKKKENKEIRHLSNVLSTSCRLNDTDNSEKIKKHEETQLQNSISKSHNSDDVDSSGEKLMSPKELKKSKKGVMDMNLVQKYIRFSEISDPSITNPTDNEHEQNIGRKKSCKRNRKRLQDYNYHENEMANETAIAFKVKKRKKHKSDNVDLSDQLNAFSLTEDDNNMPDNKDNKVHKKKKKKKGASSSKDIKGKETNSEDITMTEVTKLNNRIHKKKKARLQSKERKKTLEKFVQSVTHNRKTNTPAKLDLMATELMAVTISDKKDYINAATDNKVP